MSGNARLTPLGELEQRDLEAWRELADASVEPNPFHDPDYVMPAARALGELDQVALLVLGDGSEWSACLPVRSYPRWHRLPVRTLASWDHPYSFFRSPLIAPGLGGDPYETVIAALTDRSRVVGMDVLPESLIAANDDAVELRSDERAVLRRHPEPDYLDGVSVKHRREFKRLARQMERALDAPLEVVDRSDEAGAVETFLDLEASGWKGREGTAMASIPAHADFFRNVARSFAERGAFELLFLEGGGRPAAARVSFLAGDGSFSFKIAFDEELRKFSPGRELELRAMERFHADARRNWMDSCAQPDNRYINRLWPDRRRLTTRAYFRPGPAGRVLRAGVASALAVRKRRAAGHDEADQGRSER